MPCLCVDLVYKDGHRFAEAAGKASASRILGSFYIYALQMVQAVLLFCLLTRLSPVEGHQA